MHTRATRGIICTERITKELTKLNHSRPATLIASHPLEVNLWTGTPHKGSVKLMDKLNTVVLLDLYQGKKTKLLTDIHSIAEVWVLKVLKV